MGIKKTDTYEAYDSNYLTPGANIKIDHTVYAVEADMTDLISKPLDELKAMHEECLKTEQSAYEKVIEAARDWEPTAVATRKIERAMEYLAIPSVEHSSNKWIDDDYDRKSISNAVYKMSYSVFEYKSYRSDKPKWDLKWYIYTNSPQNNYNVKIAGQDRVFDSKEEMDKYMQGRIKAFSHLFTEISPPIPDNLTRPFTVHGHLLPGYITESDAKAKKELEAKPSVRDKLKAFKEEAKSTPKKTPTHNRNEQSLE